LNAFLKNACEAIDRLPNVLERKGVGRPRFESKSRIIAVLVKAWIGRSYRDTEAYLYDNKETLATFGLLVPDHNVIWRTMTLLAESYLKELNHQVGLSLKKGESQVAIDATGFCAKTYARRFDPLHRSGSRKEWLKLHAAVTCVLKAIPSMEVTGGEVSDTTQLGALLDFVS